MEEHGESKWKASRLAAAKCHQILEITQGYAQKEGMRKEMVETGEMIGPRIYSSGDVLYGVNPLDDVDGLLSPAAVFRAGVLVAGAP